MKAADIVDCKVRLKASGVMGSSLKEFKDFEGFALVLDFNKSKTLTKIMKVGMKIVWVKTSSLNCVISGN